MRRSVVAEDRIYVERAAFRLWTWILDNIVNIHITSCDSIATQIGLRVLECKRRWQSDNLSGHQLRIHYQLIHSSNVIERNFPIKSNGFKSIAPSHSTLNWLGINMIRDPIPAEYVEATCAATHIYFTNFNSGYSDWMSAGVVSSVTTPSIQSNSVRLNGTLAPWSIKPSPRLVTAVSA